MTAIICVKQPEHGCVHVATDAASYDRERGAIVEFGSKIAPVPNWPGVVTSAGNAAATILFGAELSRRFSMFDEMIDLADFVLPQIISGCGLPTAADVFLAGVSKEHGPKAYYFRTSDDLPPMNTREEVEANPLWGERDKLIELPDVIMTPVPHDQVVPAHYEGLDTSEHPESVRWALLKILTMQRHMELPESIGGIGGFAQIATVYADRIEQRIVHRWPDSVGDRIRPAPLDWTRWHAENPKPSLRPALRVV